MPLVQVKASRRRASYLGSQHDAARSRMQLWRQQLSLDICCPRTGCGERQTLIDGTDRQTDGRTDGHPTVT